MTENRYWRDFERVAIVVVLVASLTMLGERLLSRADATEMETGTSTRPGPAGPGGEAPLPREPISVEGITFKGDASAPIVLIEFMDFQCPACADFAREVLPAVEKEYISTGKVRLGIWHRPLSMHRHAPLAAAVAECAAKEGQFWVVHDRFFANVRGLDASSIPRLAREAGAGPDLDACLAKGVVQEQVKTANTIARGWRVAATPTFFLGVALPDGRVDVRRRWSGVRTPRNIGAMIDEVIAAPAMMPR